MISSMRERPRFTAETNSAIMKEPFAREGGMGERGGGKGGEDGMGKERGRREEKGVDSIRNT